jgi:hypothetical protein
MTSTIVTGLLTLIQILLEYRVKVAELSAVVAGLEGSLIPALEDKLWVVDSDGVVGQLQPLLKSVDASYVKLTDSSGKVWYEETLPNFIPKYPLVKEMDITSERHDGAKNILGKLSITFFKDKIVNDLRNRFAFVLHFQCT